MTIEATCVRSALALAVAAAVGLLAGCQDRGQGGADAPPALVDAAEADAGPPPTAIVFLDLSDRAPAPGGATTASWVSQYADACDVSVDGTSVAAGTTGSVEITVDAIAHVMVTCTPVGPASRARMPVATGCQAMVSVDSLVANADGVTDGAQQPFTFAPGDCIEVTGMVSFEAAHPALANRLYSADSIFEQVAGTHGQELARLDHVRFLTLDYDNGGSSDYTFPVLQWIQGPVALLSGRTDLRALNAVRVLARGEPGSMIDTPELVLDLPESSIESMEITGRDRLPLLTAPVGHVAGDVSVHHNAIAHADIEAFLTQLGVLRGAVTVCGNLDDPPCQ